MCVCVCEHVCEALRANSRLGAISSFRYYYFITAQSVIYFVISQTLKGLFFAVNDYYLLLYFEEMWVRAVWMEGDKIEKGVLPCSWLKDKYVFGLLAKRPKKAIRNNLVPTSS